MTIMSISDPRVPVYVVQAAGCDPKWRYTVHLPGSWQLLTDDDRKKMDG